MENRKEIKTKNQSKKSKIFPIKVSERGYRKWGKVIKTKRRQILTKLNSGHKSSNLKGPLDTQQNELKKAQNKIHLCTISRKRKYHKIFQRENNRLYTKEWESEEHLILNSESGCEKTVEQWLKESNEKWFPIVKYICIQPIC